MTRNDLSAQRMTKEWHGMTLEWPFGSENDQGMIWNDSGMTRNDLSAQRMTKE